MKRFFLRFAAALTLLLGTAAAVQAQSASFAAIDSLRAAAEYNEALARLEARADAQGRSAEVLWRTARTRVDRAGELEESERRKEQFRQALKEARAAVEKVPRSADAHLSLAVAAGRVGLTSGTQKKVELSRAVKKHVDRAIELNPQSDLAYHVRGRWNYEVANLGWFSRTVVKAVYGGLPDASFEQAAEDLKQALRIKERVAHHLELGKAYAKLDNEAKARKHFKRALALPNNDADDPDYKKEVRERLEEL